jgi:hypothetical protein
MLGLFGKINKLIALAAFAFAAIKFISKFRKKA